MNAWDQGMKSDQLPECLMTDAERPKAGDIVEIHTLPGESFKAALDRVGMATNSTIYQVTCGLRWNGLLLEQAWQCVRTGTIDWRPIPSKDSP